jgi:CubicO group peptidase (beta-lactamase class C family)
MNKITAVFFISLVALTKAYTQVLPDSLEKKIDKLFAQWNTSSSPGCAIGIIRNDSLIYAKGYGMADLEHGVPITPETIFYMCSVSKQFTGYAVELLARQGKIDLDKNIRTYLPWVPDFGKEVSVRNLLNHTSGIRDDISLAAISGLGSDGMITEDLSLNILKRQTSLNFTPGSAYLYSNSNYVLLSEIVSAVSGRSFRAFTDSAIFRPLEMAHSRFIDNYTELIKDRAFSYEVVDKNHFANDYQNVYTLGDGGLFTNITDMAKWVDNFFNPKVGDSKDISLFTEKGKLNNGSEIAYAMGIAVKKYRGWMEFQHAGGLAGYRTFLSVFPDLKMGFLVFSNVGNFQSQNKTHDLANLFISEAAKDIVSMKPKNTDSSLAVLKDPERFRMYMGDYIADEGIQFNFSMVDQKVYWKRNGRISLLVNKAKDTFSVFESPDVLFVFGGAPGKGAIVNEYWPVDNNLSFAKFIAVSSPRADKELDVYTGTYYCPELGCQYEIKLKEHQLVLRSNKYNDAPLKLIGYDDLIDKSDLLSHLKIIRDADKTIKGFEASSESVLHLRFDKIR